VINKRRIFPNQNGTFKRKADLFRDAGDIDATLMEVLTLLGTDLRDQLLDTEITTDLDDLSKEGRRVRGQGKSRQRSRRTSTIGLPRSVCASHLQAAAVVPRTHVARKEAASRCFTSRSTAV
jgi:hypothetical protein